MRVEYQAPARPCSRKTESDLMGSRCASATESTFPLLAAYDLCLKCSHLFNILDARGAISVTERVGVIARVRALAVGIAKAWVDQQKSESAAAGGKADEEEPVRREAREEGEAFAGWIVNLCDVMGVTFV